MSWYKLAKIDTKIILTDKESQIFSFILQIIRKNNLNLIPRVAGGWVRDKLLGKESNDIDIALDTMTGAKFAKYITDYAKQNNIEGVSAAHEIAARPEQSKHLETITMNIFGEKIEFVNLRTESYGNIKDLLSKTQDAIDNKITKLDLAQYIGESASRIPKMNFGTLQDDAERRDLTINAMYYNIIDNKVEDPTGHGLNDLESGILQAPGNPIERMAEDPLRVMRAIRFSSKMGFEITPELLNALKDPKIHMLFDIMITPERKKEEIEKIMISRKPESGMRLLHQTGLSKYIFPLPESYKPWEMEQESPHHKYNVLDHSLKVLEEINRMMLEKNVNDADRFAMNMAAFLHDIGKLDPSIQGVKEVEGKINKTYHDHQKSSTDISEKFMKALKLSNKEIEDIKTIVQYHMEPHEHGGTRTPYQLAQFVKKVGNLWDRIVDLSIADIRGTGQAKEEEFAKKEEYRKRLQSINPERVLQLKPLLSGNDLMTLLNIKPGKELGVIIQNLKEWQLQEYIKRGDIPSREEEETYIFNKFIKPFLNGNEVMVLLNISPGKQLGEIIKDLLNKQKNREITTKEQAEQYLLSKYK